MFGWAGLDWAGPGFMREWNRYLSKLLFLPLWLSLVNYIETLRSLFLYQIWVTFGMNFKLDEIQRTVIINSRLD